MIDDDNPKPAAPEFARRVPAPTLDSWSVSELHDYVEELREEIARAEAHITRKRSVREAAASFFKLGPSSQT